jgi:hypothetical protein
MTPFLSYEIASQKNLAFQENSDCSHDCYATIQITNTADGNVKLFFYKFAYARDKLGWTGERWEGFSPTLPNEIEVISFSRRYAKNESCQWTNTGVTKILAIRDATGCTWLEQYYNVNFENSGIQMIDIPNLCP